MTDPSHKRRREAGRLEDGVMISASRHPWPTPAAATIHDRSQQQSHLT
jgi:hypothetical protein